MKYCEGEQKMLLGKVSKIKGHSRITVREGQVNQGRSVNSGKIRK